MINNQQLLQRITSNPQIMVGKPVIKGTRLTVEFILNLLAHGASMAEIVEEYPHLEVEDISACLLFAASALENVDFMPLAPELV